MGAAATANPLLPSGMVAGTIAISSQQAGVPQSLLTLMQAQLDPNCPGAGQEVTIQADNSGAVYIGRPNQMGALSTSNYGYLLVAGTSALIPGGAISFQTSFPGNNAPVGDLQVLMSASGTFHVIVK